MTFNIQIDSSRQALSESVEVDQRAPILRLYLIWKFFDFFCKFVRFQKFPQNPIALIELITKMCKLLGMVHVFAFFLAILSCNLAQVFQQPVTVCPTKMQKHKPFPTNYTFLWSARSALSDCVEIFEIGRICKKKAKNSILGETWEEILFDELQQVQMELDERNRLVY